MICASVRDMKDVVDEPSIRLQFYINDEAIAVQCSVAGLNARVAQLCAAFPRAAAVGAASTLSIIADRIMFTYDDGEATLPLRADTRNLYQLLFGFVYFLTARRHMLPIHSTVVSDGAKGILITGDFGHGKTFLSEAFRRNGYDLHSGDHSILQPTDRELVCVQGSKRTSLNGVESLLDDDLVRRRVPIAKIVIVTGACEEGRVIETCIDDPIMRTRRLWPRVAWPFVSPLSGTDVLPIQTFDVQPLLSTTRMVSLYETPIVSVRGDMMTYASQFSF